MKTYWSHFQGSSLTLQVCPKTLVANYQWMLHNIPEVEKYHLHHGKIISCNIFCKINTPWTSLMFCCYKSRNVNAMQNAMSEKQIEWVLHQDSGMELSHWSYGWNAHTLPIPLIYRMGFMMKNFSIIISSKRFLHISSLYNQNTEIPQHGITAVLNKGLTFSSSYCHCSKIISSTKITLYLM